MWLNLFLVILFLCALAGFYRLIVGPSITDRVIGLDFLFAIAIAIAFCLLSAWIHQNSLYLDVALGLAVTGFVATVSWTRLIGQSPLAQKTD